MTPLVSIIIPVYNGANYLKEAIDSALAQTYKNIEIIVVNDGSTDGGETERIALSYGDGIRYVCKENGGVSSALNRGIREMKGEYFSWLSHDDVYAPEKIEKEVALLSEEKKDELVLCSCVQINKDSEKIGAGKTVPKDAGAALGWKEAVMYITRFSANGCALLIPKKAFDTSGGFDERLRYCQDIFMWWKIFLNGFSLIFCDYDGVLSRVHDKQLTQTGVALYHHDAELIGRELAPQFAEKSSREFNFLYEYSKGEAIHGNKNVVSLCLSLAKKYGLFSLRQKVKIGSLCLYGKIRPFIRRVYYRLVKKVKTQ